MFYDSVPFPHGWFFMRFSLSLSLLPPSLPSLSPGKIHLSEAAALFDSRVLSQLKKEYGGLQTLLRNEHQIFKGNSALNSLGKSTDSLLHLVTSHQNICPHWVIYSPVGKRGAV